MQGEKVTGSFGKHHMHTTNNANNYSASTMKWLNIFINYTEYQSRLGQPTGLHIETTGYSCFQENPVH